MRVCLPQTRAAIRRAPREARARRQRCPAPSGCRGHYVRPWLNVWRSDVREFLEERGITAYEDPANADTRFARVRARQLILPELERDRPGIVRKLHAAALTAARMQEAAEQAPTAVEVL
ncbi:MAG: hypothetical protein E6H95_11030, partial [Chloroflexi bacterium]